MLYRENTNSEKIHHHKTKFKIHWITYLSSPFI